MATINILTIPNEGFSIQRDNESVFNILRLGKWWYVPLTGNINLLENLIGANTYIFNCTDTIIADSTTVTGTCAQKVQYLGDNYFNAAISGGTGNGTSGYSGKSGFSGLGLSGYSGYSGKSGYSGFSGIGIAGTSGFSGYSGLDGMASSSGYSGYSGKSGYSGYSGSGLSGYSGYSGSGTSGYSGYSGFSGVSGYSGFSGTVGTSGFSGFSGKSGYSGFSGYSGIANVNYINVSLNGVTTASSNNDAAFEALVGSNKTLYIPAGTYTFTSVVTISNVSNLTIIAQKGAIFTTNQDILFEITHNITNFYLEGLAMVSTRSSTTEGGGLLNIVNYSGGSYGSDSMLNVTIKNCDFTCPASASNGVKMVHENDGTIRNLNVIDCTLHDIGRFGIELQNNLGDGVFRYIGYNICGNYLRDIGLIQTAVWVPVAISVSGDGRDGLIEGNHIIDVHSTPSGLTALGIENACNDNVTISNNVLSSESYGFQAIAFNPLYNILTSKRKVCNIIGNTINLTGTESGNVFIRGIVISYLIGGNIIGNEVTTSGYGLVLDNSSENLISDNKFYSLALHVAYVQANSTNNYIRNNTLDNSGGAGNTGLIMFEGSGTTGNIVKLNALKMQGDVGGYIQEVSSATGNSVSQYGKYRTITTDFTGIVQGDDYVFINIGNNSNIYLPTATYYAGILGQETWIKNISNTYTVTLNNNLASNQKTVLQPNEGVLCKSDGTNWYTIDQVTTGNSGYSGYSGKSGYSGFSGVSGYSGFSGKSGYSGYSGNPGASIVKGSFSQVGSATTTFTVTFGGTQPNNTYQVAVTPTAILSAALFYVNNKTTTTFDVVYMAGLTGTVTFDFELFQ